MAKMNSQFKYMYDAAPSISLVPKDHVAKTADFTGTAIILDTVQGYWNAGTAANSRSLADTTFAVVINVEEFDGAEADAAVLTLEFGPVGFESAITVGTVTVNKAGQYVILVDADTVKFQKPDVAAMRLKGDLAAAGSVTLHAFIGGAIIR
jgi:hypothetical protein